MPNVQQEYQDRVAEIAAYLEHVRAIEDGTVLLMSQTVGAHVAAYLVTQRDDLVRTFKAGAFLMLYNLMEATVRNAVEAIFDELTTQGVSFDACRREVRRVVLNNLKQIDNKGHLDYHNVRDAVDLFTDLARDVVNRTFQRERVVSGNVDARKIKELAKKYGFAEPAGNSSRLLTVKTRRNSLAHGDQSFAEVGRNVTVPELDTIKTEVVAYLAMFITNITVYLTQQHYLSGPGRP